MVQPYTPGDLNDCADLYCELFTAPVWDYHWLKKESIARYFSDLSITPGFCGYLWKEDQTMLGLCLGLITDYFGPAQYEIKEICIAQAYQRQGKGSAFLKEVEKRLLERGVSTITLFTLDKIPAYSFYVKNEYCHQYNTVHFMKQL